MSTLNDALAAIPGVAAIDAALKAAKKRPMPAPQADLVAEMIDHFKAGGDIPDDLGQRAYDASRVREYMEQRNGVLSSIEARLTNERDNLIHRQTDTALDFLRERLTSALGEARELLDSLTRSGVHSLDVAARAGEAQVNDWFRFEKLASDYTDIRQAQLKLCREHNHGGAEGYAVVQRVGELRNRDNLWHADQDGRDPRSFTPPPWPHTDPSKGLPDYGIEYLRWLVTTPEAEPWLPSLAQLRTEFDAANERYQERREARTVRVDTRKAS